MQQLHTCNIFYQPAIAHLRADERIRNHLRTLQSRAFIVTSRFQPPGKDCIVPMWQRKPRRISITLCETIYTELLDRSSKEGRSISNLAAFLLEKAINENRDLFGEAQEVALTPSGTTPD